MASPASAVTPAFAERLVAFSCKGRGVCPSCSARRMGGVAAHLTDQVLPPLPLRQWVLSLPKRIRPFLPHDPRLAGDVLRVLLRGIRTTLRRASPSATGYAQLGAVSFLHRFGSALNPHFHFHVVVLDGVFSEGDDGSATFHEATHLSTDDVLRLERTLQRRVFRLLRRRGLLDEHTVEDMLTWQASRGFSLDASVRIHGSDAAGRERLLRYGARPPFALERLRIDRRRRRARATHPTASHCEAGIRQAFYHAARPTRDGRTILALSPVEFLAALSRLIPPPRVHRHRYHGVLAPNARLRERIVALGRHDGEAPGDMASPAGTTCRPGPARPRPGATTPTCRTPRAGRRPLPLGSPPRPHLRGLPPHLPRLRRRHAHPRLHHRRRTRRRHPHPPRPAHHAAALPRPGTAPA
jgi:hypothetical protein